LREFETLEQKEEIDMRAWTLKIPQKFKDGYFYMLLMDEMIRYEFKDVEDKVLFTFRLDDFHTDHDQKDKPFEERDAWIATVTTNFKFADDEDCRGVKPKKGVRGFRGMIGSCLGSFFNLEVGDRKL